ncbi:MAG: Ubiquitin-conjugating enzyme E2 6 [Heterodermia speciosa]|uniref:Ubiquitin-conjugating enzyme E2 6 n=1 Tax=Heterodermia speciosa TaxID=116794 RepID=A0A8H3ISK4_9LECA|nr:MAG: Ubiquitin-conjugating enzyme E2 6 [Heterodermia speciosa]
MLTREYTAIQANPPPYIIAHPSETNILEWHYILTGPPATPYEGGQYWGTLLFPPDYPFAPPSIRMHTPSGRFQPSTRLCLSISDFHPKSFNPAWEVSTILIGLMSFMTSDEMTTGSVHASDTERKWLAARTRWWNSTGGGSRTEKKAGVSASVKGIGAVKAGDGGVKFRAEWPELDSENFDWMKKHRIDAANGNLKPDETGKPSLECSAEVSALVRGPKGSGGLGAVRDGGQAAREAGRGWVSRHKWKLAAIVVLAYVVLSRAVGEKAQ